MLQNARVTDFTLSKLLCENQQGRGGGNYAPTQGLGLMTKWLWVRIPLLSVSFLFCNSFEFIKLLYTFLVISFAQYKEYMICLISFDKFSDVLSAFICTSAIGNR